MGHNPESQSFDVNPGSFDVNPGCFDTTHLLKYIALLQHISLYEIIICMHTSLILVTMVIYTQNDPFYSRMLNA